MSFSTTLGAPLRRRLLTGHASFRHPLDEHDASVEATRWTGRSRVALQQRTWLPAGRYCRARAAEAIFMAVSVVASSRRTAWLGWRYRESRI